MACAGGSEPILQRRRRQLVDARGIGTIIDQVG
jgi:hypothetical protein